MMFNLKRPAVRPIVFLLTILIENALLSFVWFHCYTTIDGKSFSNQTTNLIYIIAAATIAGVLFLSLYLCCKPDKTDLCVLYHIETDGRRQCLNESDLRAFNSTRYGIYYHFCSLIFRLESSGDIRSSIAELRRRQLI
ncbi:XK-related domain containing protein 2-like protein [Dinothrombium tinctorium]|uniref:XK-related domain containing protein 2-like protein n=1 Tax=Dinothrombium tinctorium TaxID=1965070 RepID=A0A3S3S4A1_9ACAR|nr:XK-related domain containing protein 2-like protein [Dinothrombium tinctorium]